MVMPYNFSTLPINTLVSGKKKPVSIVKTGIRGVTNRCAISIMTRPSGPKAVEIASRGEKLSAAHWRIAWGWAAENSLENCRI